MRLASKIFLTSAVVVVLLGVVGVLSLRAVGRLASVNREITTRTVPALRLAASTRDAVPALVRLEARFLVLNDARFIGAWNERAERLRTSLIRLREYATSAQESRLLEDATESFERYYGTVGQVQGLLTRGQRVRAAALSEGASRSLAERVEATPMSCRRRPRSRGSRRARGRASWSRWAPRSGWRCSVADSSRTV
jgi:hypothetical protein